MFDFFLRFFGRVLICFFLKNAIFFTRNSKKKSYFQKAKATEASSGGGRRGAGGNFMRILDNYLEWLQNRGVLDKVLDDCRWVWWVNTSRIGSTYFMLRSPQTHQSEKKIKASDFLGNFKIFIGFLKILTLSFSCEFFFGLYQFFHFSMTCDWQGKIL